MSTKNVLIFSDGTGQAGGFRFDETRSNIYKLYRATRCGPDSSIDPREQVAFYDPGLGSQADGGHLPGRLFRWVHNVVSLATGFGITRNIIDCYAALIQLWRPGDRIFLFGFSRGAYTVRCVAGVIAQCGIPMHPKGGRDNSLKLDAASAQKLAAYAVKHVYQFTYPRKQNDATPYQKFLLDTRELLARRFRQEYGSGDADDPDKSNVYPHFIGVFDTVAALGNYLTTTLFSFAFLAFAAAMGVLGDALTQFPDVPVIGSILHVLSFNNVFWGIVRAGIVVMSAIYVFTHLKWDFSVPSYGVMQLLSTLHFNDLWMKFYDCDLNKNVDYARQAISIDENRKKFEPVAWFGTKDTSRDEHGIQWLEQVWFAGSHQDIGGGYPENDSRLSDIALNWMLGWATVIPHGLKHDPEVLNLSPHPEGVQHDEVKVGFGLLTKYCGITWTEKRRALPSPRAITHRSVYQRFDFGAVQVFDEMTRYRPTTLAEHVDFSDYYWPGARFLPARSLRSATALAENPWVRQRPFPW